MGSLGEKIGEGAAADVHVWAPEGATGQVVKLFKRAESRQLAEHEVRMTRAAFAAGLPAPRVFGEVMVADRTGEERFGIVLQRFDGPALTQLTRSGAVTRDAAGKILAALAATVHDTPPPKGVPTLHGWVDVWLRGRAGFIPEHIDAGVRARLERLPKSDRLTHGDLHPGNVIMTAEGPRLVDWAGMVRAPAAYDLAVAHVLLTDLAPEVADDPERPRAIDAALQAAYAPKEAIEPYLPIVRVMIVLGGAVPAMHERLLARAAAGLRDER
jgi:Ser/Thr protein kinase RdoA (MazF antagonist)